MHENSLICKTLSTFPTGRQTSTQPFKQCTLTLDDPIDLDPRGTYTDARTHQCLDVLVDLNKMR